VLYLGLPAVVVLHSGTWNTTLLAAVTMGAQKDHYLMNLPAIPLIPEPS